MSYKFAAQIIVCESMEELENEKPSHNKEDYYILSAQYKGVPILIVLDEEGDDADSSKDFFYITIDGVKHRILKGRKKSRKEKEEAPAPTT